MVKQKPTSRPPTRKRKPKKRKRTSASSVAGLKTVASSQHYRWLVFVSSALPRPRSQLIGRDRLAATRAISELEGLFYAWTWEQCAFPGQFAPPDLYIKEAEKAHMLILLIHERLTPNTKKEYVASVKKRRSQMILFRDGCKLEGETRKFQKKLRAATYFKYKNPSELKSIIINGLQANLLLYATRGLDASVGTRRSYSRLGL